MAQVVLGVNNGFAAKHWPEPEEWARVVAERLCLREVQLSFDLLHPGWPQPLRDTICRRTAEAASRFGLTVRSTFSGLIAYSGNLLGHPSQAAREQARNWCEAAIAVTAALGAEATGGHMGALSASDWEDPTRRQAMRCAVVDSVRDLTQVASAQGLKYLLWELMPSPREAPHTPEEAIAVMEEVNEGAAVPVRLAFDLGHCCAHDLPKPGDPHEWLERLLAWTPMVHLQQTDGRGDRHWPFTSEYEAAGIIQPRRIVEIARSSPLPRVDLVLEVIHVPETPPERVIEDLRRSVDTWTRWM